MTKNSILFIIVVYKDIYYKTESFKTLLKSFRVNKNDEQLHLFIADNTDTVGWHFSALQELEDVNISYQHFSDNPGLSYAYNRGADFAKRWGFQWIVLLDQDTNLPIPFYLTYCRAVQNSNVPLKVPISLIAQDRVLSPSYYLGYRAILFNKVETGIKKIRWYSFINTGLLINLNFYFDVGGYNEHIKLDFADHDFVYKSKKFTNVFELLDVRLHQDFSSITHSRQQALTRYRTYLDDLKSFAQNKRYGVLLFINADFLRLVSLTLKYKSMEFLKARVTK